MTEELLTATELSRVHHGRGGRQRVALHPLSVALRRGESTAVVGGSGSGKSSLVRLLLGLDTPSTGTVTTGDGLPVTDRRWLRRTGVVLQDPATSLDPRMRVGRIVAEPLRGFRIRGDHDAAARSMLDRLGLPGDAADRYPHEFSGGQRQRIAIARALVHEPEVLVADEPLSALDVTVRARILTLLRELVAERGLTLLLVSHDLGIVQRVSERVLVLDDGSETCPEPLWLR
ncbi:ATP-binding cassette domain-containing protein, partial [Mycetocola reblochoni]|uniref:ATP-binding cassette domain-containing protein n=1 Tax=Mycetocola reblochoni TaxID=331618 RepID=UPI003F9C04DA